MPDWLVILFFLLALFILIGFLNNRSNNFAEEIRKSKIIVDLPISQGDITKLFKTRRRANQNIKNRKRYGSSKIDFDSFEEISPLKLLGYSVGASGLSDADRTHVLNLAMFGDFQRHMPDRFNFDVRWGQPGSRIRFARIYNHIRRVKNLRNNRRNMSIARSNWAADMQYIQQQQRLIYKFRLYAPNAAL